MAKQKWRVDETKQVAKKKARKEQIAKKVGEGSTW